MTGAGINYDGCEPECPHVAPGEDQCPACWTFQDWHTPCSTWPNGSRRETAEMRTPRGSILDAFELGSRADFDLYEENPEIGGGSKRPEIAAKENERDARNALAAIALRCLLPRWDLNESYTPEWLEAHDVYAPRILASCAGQYRRRNRADVAQLDLPPASTSHRCPRCGSTFGPRSQWVKLGAAARGEPCYRSECRSAHYGYDAPQLAPARPVLDVDAPALKSPGPPADEVMTLF